MGELGLDKPVNTEEKCDCLWCEGAGGHDQDPAQFAVEARIPPIPGVWDFAGVDVANIYTPIYHNYTTVAGNYVTANPAPADYNTVPGVFPGNNPYAYQMRQLDAANRMINAFQTIGKIDGGGPIEAPLYKETPELTGPQATRAAVKRQKEEFTNGLRKFKQWWWKS